MILEETLNQVTPKDIALVLFGIGVTALSFFFYKVWKRMTEHKQLPYVIFLDIPEWRPHFLGYYDGNVNLRIPVNNSGSTREFWGIRTLTNRGPRFLVPSFGNKEDLILRDETRMANFYFIVGTLLGTGAEGSSVHQLWLDDAFPERLYDMGAAAEIPEQFILCKPLFNKQMLKAAYIEKLFNIQGVYTMYNHMQWILRENSRANFDQLTSMMVSSVQTANDHLMTQWSCIYDSWNTFHKERTVPLFVLSQLLHIAPSKVGYAGLNQTLNSGSIQAAIPFIKSMRGSMEEMAELFDTVPMDKTMLQLMEAKMNKNKEELINTARENAEYEEAMRGMNMQLQAMGGNRQQSSQNSVIKI